ncbi:MULTISPECIES: IclR family transcriptional regulator [Bosea]|jgi:DNA-binding IclR family transcriptional regulator|uniref:IclR family transcriptional regulator n=2 Tax=Bosea TaxID=85413 RepID=A0ABW0IV01_9HYPH|nr:IclR family transcriptional regulator [Bosea sp. (in: a-proteobacteria)]TAJ31481.1 MAG: IclR family transcriptional regulator [Bosea sp. (in: a-proteobacteria)]
MSASPDQDLSPKIVGAVANAVSILRSLAQMSEPAGVAVIARDTGVSVSTCFNILRTLSTERLVDFDAEAKTYRIGLGVLELSLPLLGANQADLIRPELARLSGEHKSLLCLWQVTDGERIVLVDRVSTAKTVRVDMSDGSRLPTFVGAVGRCYAALRNLPRDELKLRFDALQWQAPPSFEDYAADVEKARRDGYAFDLGQLFKGLEIAAAVVTDAEGRPRLGISGISIAGQLSREDIERLGVDLRDSADWISEALFGVSRGVRQSERRLAGGRAAPQGRGGQR